MCGSSLRSFGSGRLFIGISSSIFTFIKVLILSGVIYHGSISQYAKEVKPAATV